MLITERSSTQQAETTMAVKAVEEQEDTMDFFWDDIIAEQQCSNTMAGRFI